MYQNKSAKLILENGIIFCGYSFGKIGTSIGEICFNTGMTGYQEILTDPSYCGQIITMTASHIGVYGVNEEDIESKKIHASGFIVKECSPITSNYRSTDSLDNYLKKNNIIGIQGVDTRLLTRILRTEGVMNGIISSQVNNNEKLKKLLKNHPRMEGLNLVKKVSCKKSYFWNKKIGKYKVAAIDYGIKYNILRLLEKSGCEIQVFPYNSSTKEILQYNPDGIFLSNGPGDPAAAIESINTIKGFIKINIPIFGICLGHQILSLAFGAQTFKLKFGHRGCNHPVKNNKTNSVEITSQNHGFSVVKDSLPKNIHITHISLNDNTIEGICCIDKPIFSVQHHPEASPGPHDSRYLFKQFIDFMKVYKNRKQYAKTK